MDIFYMYLISFIKSKTMNLIAQFKEEIAEIVHKNLGSLQVHDIT